MNTNKKMSSGIYIAYPTVDTWKSIYRKKGYKTKVNNDHTKVGKAENFESHRGQYLENFDNEVEYTPIIEVNLNKNDLKKLEDNIKAAVLKAGFKRVGRAKEWYETTDRKKLINIIYNTIKELGIDFQLVDGIKKFII